MRESKVEPLSSLTFPIAALLLLSGLGTIAEAVEAAVWVLFARRRRRLYRITLSRRHRHHAQGDSKWSIMVAKRPIAMVNMETD